MNNARIVQSFTKFIKSHFNINFRGLLKNMAKSTCAVKNIYQFAEVHFTI
jgi:hypothetical protein